MSEGEEKKSDKEGVADQGRWVTIVTKRTKQDTKITTISRVWQFPDSFINALPSRARGR